VTGLLRGFDQFMNLVLDETVEQVRPSTANALFCVALARRATLPPARCAHLRLE
jgi:small nuclear ribonucleoprotein (snRNP)-like protein